MNAVVISDDSNKEITKNPFTESDKPTAMEVCSLFKCDALKDRGDGHEARVNMAKDNTEPLTSARYTSSEVPCERTSFPVPPPCGLSQFELRELKFYNGDTKRCTALYEDAEGKERECKRPFTAHTKGLMDMKIERSLTMNVFLWNSLDSKSVNTVDSFNDFKKEISAAFVTDIHFRYYWLPSTKGRLLSNMVEIIDQRGWNAYLNERKIDRNLDIYLWDPNSQSASMSSLPSASPSRRSPPRLSKCLTIDIPSPSSSSPSIRRSSLEKKVGYVGASIYRRDGGKGVFTRDDLHVGSTMSICHMCSLSKTLLKSVGEEVPIHIISHVYDTRNGILESKH